MSYGYTGLPPNLWGDRVRRSGGETTAAKGVVVGGKGL